MTTIFTKESVLKDFKLAHLSRQISLLGRKEVLNGKAKFGIFGDGKEIPQLALAKTFQNGDFRSGYYRDQTWLMAAGIFSAEEFFAQLYGDTDLEYNPAHGGRLMNNHFATRSLNADGSWKDLTQQKNSSPDISPTAGQMPRLLGLALASKLYRRNKELHKYTDFSLLGNEVAFGSIGDASTSEGHFFETMNAAGVLQVPMAITVYDDGYGISVEKKYQTTKESISELLEGFRKTDEKDGFLIYQVKGWDYEALCNTFEEGIAQCRKNHIPVLFHVSEVTQPQGHSTSGSHERYKSTERLQWERDFDGLVQFRQWILDKKLATSDELETLEKEAAEEARQAREKAWVHFNMPHKQAKEELLRIIDGKKCACSALHKEDKVAAIAATVRKNLNPVQKDLLNASKQILRHVCKDCAVKLALKHELNIWLKENHAKFKKRYSSHLHSQSKWNALHVNEIKPLFSEKSKMVPGREILRDNFDQLFEKYPLLVTFGEDAGKIGGVNQSLEGLQEKYGELRIFDTGIREATIVGQAIGLALRGFRPIAEIQYFDYLLYAIQTLSDDLATMQYRTVGGQKAPAIISTRGHRLEGVWHSGSPLSMVINSVRGVYVCVPRNMTQAAGFYNTILQSDEPALIIEPLNGYRLKEKRPDNVGNYTIPLGKVEILKSGTDVTIVTYGSCVRIAEEAVEQLLEFGISCELIDVQTLIPFDREHKIAESVKKTNRVLFFDEDVPGGATAYMMKKVLEDQKAYFYLDAEPKTLSAEEHRPAYTSDGDYFSNPNAEDVFDAIYELMHEANPAKFPELY
jgi:pyruvate/2-oxoglutarate/acetoin dehydrogenase E1 component/TPP-dependent pyruvate/acetoin dehydrogenase alpha subunit